MNPRPVSPPLYVYTSASQLTDPLNLLRSMAADIVASRELAWRLLIRNISSRYRRTMLGCVWAFLPPILTTTVFVFLQRSGYFTVGPMPVPYAVFLFAGLILWQVFCDSINMPLQMVQQSSAILTKVNFPREALILAGTGEVLFGFVIRFVLMLSILFWFKMGVSWTLLWVPCGILVLMSMGIGLGLILTPVGVLYHDISQGIPFVLYLWMFLTPVLYPVPQSWPASLSVALNPIGAVLDTTRAWLLGSVPAHVDSFVITAALAIVILLFGWLLYRLALPILLERIGA